MATADAKTAQDENADAGVGATGGLQPQAISTADAGLPPSTSGRPDSALFAAVNDARMHPENYPPNPDPATGQIAPGFGTTACPALHESSSLDDAASTHIGNISNVSNAVLMGGDGRNAHRNPPPYGPLPTDPGGSIEQAGYHSALGEIVAWGYPDAQTAVINWMQNDGNQGWGHRNIILGCTFTDAGASSLAGGVAGPYWVVDLGRR